MSILIKPKTKRPWLKLCCWPPDQFYQCHLHHRCHPIQRKKHDMTTVFWIKYIKEISRKWMVREGLSFHSRILVEDLIKRNNCSSIAIASYIIFLYWVCVWRNGVGVSSRKWYCAKWQGAEKKRHPTGMLMFKMRFNKQCSWGCMVQLGEVVGMR